MKTKLFFVNFLCSFLFAAACGGNNGSPTKPDGGNKDCNNNDKCEVGENCGNCLADCPCQEGMKCTDGECVSALCGNGECNSAQGENCLNCGQDCSCPEDKKCGQSGACVYLSCGDGKGVCDPWENCLCPEDCPSCGQNQFCDRDGICVDASTLCGNGQCDTDWEACGNCLEDCPCPEGTQCKYSSCVAPFCGDDNCDPGENCGNCLADCPCPAEKVCNEAGSCVFTPPPTCQNGACEEWEHCGNCPADCVCPETTACNEAGTCQYICPDPERPPEVCKPKDALEAGCGDWGEGLKCYGGFSGGQPCLIDAECQAVPPLGPETDAKARTGRCSGYDCAPCYHGTYIQCNGGPKSGQTCQTDDDCCASFCEDGWFSGKVCEIDADCQETPYPPCVCWEVGCGLRGVWDCSEKNDGTSLFFTISLASSTSREGESCKISVLIHSGYDRNEEYFAKPGDSPPIDLSGCNPISGYTCGPGGIGYEACRVW